MLIKREIQNGTDKKENELLMKNPLRSRTCNCKYFWQQKLVTAESVSSTNFFTSILEEMITEDVNLTKYKGELDNYASYYVVYKNELIYVWESRPEGFNVLGQACITCGTCIGWNVDVKKLKRDIMEEIATKYERIIEESLAKEICKWKDIDLKD